MMDATSRVRADRGGVRLRARVLPDGIGDLLRADEIGGVIDGDGRLLALSARMLVRLGFQRDDDLSGLPFLSLWDHADRPALAAALDGLPDDARRRPEAAMQLDLGYLTNDDRDCALRFWRCGRHVLFELDCGGAASG